MASYDAGMQDLLVGAVAFIAVMVFFVILVLLIQP